MKLAIECRVESTIKLLKIIEIENKNKKYIFYPDSKGILDKIRIIAQVDNPEKFFSTISIPKNSSVPNIDIKIDEKLFNSIIEEFQELESDLSFTTYGNLKKINYENPSHELICETEEEKKKAPLIGVEKGDGKYPVEITELNEFILKEIIYGKEDYQSLMIPKAFLREGMNEFHSFRYINAFFNFHFILEGLYGNKKTKNSAVEFEFKRSAEFQEILEWIISNIKKEERHFKKITQMLKERNKILDADGIIHLIVSTRGDLHHFSNIPTKKQGTPFNHSEFESIAWITLGLASRAIAEKIVKINQEKMDSNTLIDYALRFKQLHKYSEAIEFCEAILKRDPSCDIAWEILGETYESLGKHEKANECYKKICK